MRQERALSYPADEEIHTYLGHLGLVVVSPLTALHLVALRGACSQQDANTLLVRYQSPFEGVDQCMPRGCGWLSG